MTSLVKSKIEREERVGVAMPKGRQYRKRRQEDSDEEAEVHEGGDKLTEEDEAVRWVEEVAVSLYTRAIVPQLVERR